MPGERGDGVDEPLDYRVALTIAADEITADYAGIRVDLPANERVSVRFMDADGRDEVFIKAWERKPATP